MRKIYTFIGYAEGKPWKYTFFLYILKHIRRGSLRFHQFERSYHRSLHKNEMRHCETWKSQLDLATDLNCCMPG